MCVGIVASLAISLCFQSARAQSNSAIHVSPNVRVSASNPNNAHWENRIAADPENAQHLVACSFIFSNERNSFNSVVYTSADGGKIWSETLREPPMIWGGDPECIFGLNGSAYFVDLVQFPYTSDPPKTAVYRSLDGGMKWEKPQYLRFIDREYLTIDRTQGKYRGRIYLHGNSSENPTVDNPDDSRSIFNLFRSFDGGTTYQPEVVLLPDGTDFPIGSGNGEVLSDGSYVTIFGKVDGLSAMKNTPNSDPVGLLKVARSEDGGENFQKASIVAPWYMPRQAAVSCIPMLAADHSEGPFKDRLYAVWNDQQSGHNDIHFSYSPDKGKTWSVPQIINDEPDRNSPDRFADHLIPVVAVNKRGVVGIQWYDRRDSPDDIGWETRFTASLDGGETFLPSMKVSEGQQTHRSSDVLPIFVLNSGGGSHRPRHRSDLITSQIQSDQGENSGGDTSGLAADADGVFHPLWVDNRTGIMQLWTAAVTVDGKGVVNGSEDLASLKDVTRSIALETLNTKYDPKTQTISYDAMLFNSSEKPVTAPIKLRVVNLNTSSRAIEVVNADNHQNGTGAVWDFSGLVQNGVLQPGERTGAKRFVLHIADFRPFRRQKDGTLPWDMASITSKILAKE
jgi:hypothetical protein